jgi:hypothetical protein
MGAVNAVGNHKSARSTGRDEFRQGPNREKAGRKGARLGSLLFEKVAHAPRGERH